MSRNETTNVELNVYKWTNKCWTNTNPKMMRKQMSKNVSQSTGKDTLCGRPMRGLLPHLCWMTSLIRCFCPLYVVKMEICSPGYPSMRMYMNTATTYSASARFWGIYQTVYNSDSQTVFSRPCKNWIWSYVTGSSDLKISQHASIQTWSFSMGYS